MTDFTAMAREWLVTNGVDQFEDELDFDELIASLAAKLTLSHAAGRAEGMEEAARWHDEQAEMCRHIAKTTREEWCGPDLSEEDRRANHKDAREHDILAGIHDRHARGVRALASSDPAPRDQVAEVTGLLLVEQLREFGEMPFEGGATDPLIEVINRLAHQAADEIERLERIAALSAPRPAPKGPKEIER